MPKERPITEVRLGTPIEHGSEKIEVLRIRKPIARDMRAITAAPTFGTLLDMAATLCNQPASVLDQLEPEDAMQVVGVVGAFFPDFPGTGA